MGLDMWIYGIKEINEKDIPENVTEEWLDDNDYSYVQQYEDDDEFDKMYHDLYDYSIMKNVIFTDIDYDKIKEDNKLPKNAILAGWQSDGTFIFQYGIFHYGEYSKLIKEVTISDEEFKKYDKQVIRKALIYKYDELAYWRKEYGLQDLIYNEYNGNVYNCGFHKIDDELMKKINKYLKLREMDEQSINDDGYIVKMYHEWY